MSKWAVSTQHCVLVVQVLSSFFECILIFFLRRSLLAFLATWAHVLAHVQMAVSQHPYLLFCWAAFQTMFPQPVELPGLTVTRVLEPALGFVKPHITDLSLLIQPVQVPVQSLPTLKWEIEALAQQGIIFRLTKVQVIPLSRSLMKILHRTWWVLENTTSDWLPLGYNSTDPHSLGPATWPVHYPAKGAPVWAMSRQLLQEKAV